MNLIEFDPVNNIFNKISSDPLHSKTSKIFETKKTNIEKLKIVQKFVAQGNHIPAHKPNRAKCNQIARHIRLKGNKLFEKAGGETVASLDVYNQSICMAIPDSVDYGIAFANRSAAYLGLRKPELCLVDIKNARESGYPLALMDKLKNREKECKDMIRNGLGVRMGGKCEKVKPFVKDCLERKENKEYGRHLVTTERVNPGETLMVEEAFACQPAPQSRYKRCWNCLAENNKQLYPCKTCTQVMFCSKECQKEADRSYHPIECPIIDYLFETLQELHLLAIRTVIKSVLAFGSLTKLGEFIEKHGTTKVDYFSKVEEGLYENDAQRKFHEVMIIVF